MKKNYFLAILVTSTALFSACSDDLGPNATTYNDGYLHFKFLFDKKGQWKDDGASGPQTRMMAPIEMTLPEGFSTPLYLHCVESSEIETAAEDTTETRGERITGDAFDSRYKIQRFGLYAVVGGEEVLSTYEDTSDPSTKQSSYMEISRSELTEESGWNVKEQELLFAGDGKWTDTKTGNFYGFAPFPGWDGAADASHPAGESGRTRCIMVNTDDPAAPTITFMMQPEEEYNKDILTAKAAGVTKAQKDAGIELKFKHVLSALKFKLDDDDTDSDGTTNDFTYSPGALPGVVADAYYLQLKSITVEGILDEGTMVIGADTWTPGSSIGSCTSVLNRSFGTVTTDGQINTDAKCMMVLPQTISSSSANKNAKLIITVDVTRDPAGTDIYKKDATFEASLAGLAWEPGHTYTYKISKDNHAKEYHLTSTNTNTGNAFQFEVDGKVTSGWSEKFDVSSYAELSDDGVTTTTAAAPWHIEYSEDYDAVAGEWKNWKAGLPLGWNVEEFKRVDDTDPSDPKDIYEEIDVDKSVAGSEAAKKYRLIAPVRLDGSPAVAALTTHDYSEYAGDDGYYDLSLHGLGWNARATTTARNTANCYIINGYGKFKIPLVYGNGMKQGLENPKAYQYAWEKNTTYDETGLTYTNDRNGHDVFCDHNGNQINNSWISAQLGNKELSGAEIVWEDHDNIVRSSSVKLDDTKKDYLCFEIRKEDVQPGNLVLAVKDGSNIAWSWHIWVTVNTDFATTKTLSKTIGSNTYSMDVAKYSLGWTNPIIKNNKGTKPFKIRVVQNDKMGKHVDHDVEQNGGIVSSENSTLIYQNGRKDPFPNYGLKITGTPTEDASGNITATYSGTNLFEKLGITDHIIESGVYSPAYAIKNPKSFIFSTGNWFLENGLKSSFADPGNPYQCYECWNPEGNPDKGAGSANEDNYKTHTKTIYDPSPVGFMVPNSGIIFMLTSDTPFTTGQTMEIDDEGHTATAPYPYVETNSGLRFYTTGGRRINSVSGRTYTMERDKGFFWTAALKQNGGYGVWFSATNTSGSITIVNEVSSSRTVASGFSVRPIKDDQMEEVAAWGTEPVKTFHEGDALNVTLKPDESPNVGITDLTSVGFTIDGGLPVTLASLLADTGKKNKKLLIKNIRVYFEYTGGKTLIETLNPYSIAYGEEKKGSSAFVLLTSIPDHYQFSAHWATKYSESTSTPVSSWNLANLVSLATSRVKINSVVADLRFTYTN